MTTGGNGLFLSVGRVSSDGIYASRSFNTYNYIESTDEYRHDSALIIRQPEFSYNGDIPINPSGFGLKSLMSEEGVTAVITAPYANVLNKTIQNMMSNPKRNVDESKDYEFYEGKSIVFAREVGAAYIYSYDGSWIKTDKEFYQKKDAIPQCRFGGQIAGTRSLDRIAVACYSEFSDELPHCLGEVYIIEKDREEFMIAFYKDMVHLPQTNKKINNADTMRYGGCLNFDDDGNLFIGIQTKGNNVEGNTEVLDRNYKKIATISNMNYFENRVRESIIKDGMIAILGRSNANPVPDQTIELISRKSRSEWELSPSQTIDFPSSEGNIVRDMISCSASLDSDLHFLAVIMKNVATNTGFIRIYKLIDNKLEFYQEVRDPEVIAPNCDPKYYDCSDYKSQKVDFGCDFAWNTQTCDNFFVGSPSTDTFSRVYQFYNASVEVMKSEPINGNENNLGADAKNPKGGLGGGEIAGIVIVLVVVIGAAAVGALFFIRKKRKVPESSPNHDVNL